MEAPDKTFFKYRAVNYYLNQIGEYQGQMVPSQYANYIDEKYGTSLADLNSLHQQFKYGIDPKVSSQKIKSNVNYPRIIEQIRSQVPFRKRLISFLNIYHTLHYFAKPKLK